MPYVVVLDESFGLKSMPRVCLAQWLVIVIDLSGTFENTSKS